MSMRRPDDLHGTRTEVSTVPVSFLPGAMAAHHSGVFYCLVWGDVGRGVHVVIGFFDSERHGGLSAWVHDCQAGYPASYQ